MRHSIDDLRAACEALGAALDAGGRHRRWRRGNRADDRLVRALMHEGELHSVGVGYKRIGGKETDELALRFYCVRKRPSAELSRACRVPPTLSGIPTDVVEAHWPRWFIRPALSASQAASAQRPICPGVSVSGEEAPLGSLGAVVVHPNGERSMLTAAHVASDDNPPLPKGAFFQPAITDDPMGSPVGVVGRLVPSDWFAAQVEADAATIQCDSSVKLDLEIPGIGIPKGTRSAKESLGRDVVKHGRATLLTRGNVESVSHLARIRVVMGGVIREVVYRDQIAIKGIGGNAFAGAGDSGSLVVDAATLEAVGLIVAGEFAPGATDPVVVVTPIDVVLAALGVALA